MSHQFKFRFLTSCVLLVLSVSCTAQPTPSLPAVGSPGVTLVTPTALPTTPLSAKSAPVKPIKTPQPRKTQAPEVFPTSSYVPDTAQFNIILGRPTDDSITASLYSKTDVQVELAYGVAPDTTASRTAPIQLKAGIPKNIELTGLSPDTLYAYQVIINSAPSGEHTFHTQRSPGDAFTFTIDADPHNRDQRFNGELYARTLANALNGNPDFHINLGDTFMTEKVQARTYAEAESTFLDIRPYFGLLGASVPLFLINGNHEGELGWLRGGGQDSLPVWSAQLRQLYYPNPIPNGFYSGSAALDASLDSMRDGYYAWTWGDALFVALDPFWYTTQKPQANEPNSNWNWTLGKEQYDWLKSTLETSQAKFKFVFIHHLVGGAKDGRGGIEFASFYEWGGNNADGSYGFDEHRPGWGKPIHQLLVESQVSAVFHGHDHVFVHQELDGIEYQECPQPSNTDYNSTRLATDYGYLSGDVRSSSGHLLVSVTAEQVTVEYVRAYLAQDERSGQQNGQVDYYYFISTFEP